MITQALAGVPQARRPQRRGAALEQVRCSSELGLDRRARAATAASLLRRAGAEQVLHVTDDGVPTWGQLGKPLERTPLE